MNFCFVICLRSLRVHVQDRQWCGRVFVHMWTTVRKVHSPECKLLGGIEEETAVQLARVITCLPNSVVL